MKTADFQTKDRTCLPTGRGSLPPWVEDGNELNTAVYARCHSWGMKIQAIRKPSKSCRSSLQKNAQTSDILHLMEGRRMDSLKSISELWDPTNKPIQSREMGEGRGPRS